MIISSIVAVSKNNVIGHGNAIPWYLAADLKFFKNKTTHHPIIMGRNCYASIGKPLPNRTNIIVTRDPFFISTNCLIARTIQEALLLAKKSPGSEEIFIIGGGQIYDQTVDLWDRLYLTEVDIEVEGDVFFTNYNAENWKQVSEECHTKDTKNEFDYCFKILERKSP